MSNELYDFANVKLVHTGLCKRETRVENNYPARWFSRGNSCTRDVLRRV